jgi:hypothetical protein
MRIIVSLAAAGVLLAACTSGPNRISYGYLDPGYSLGQVVYASEPGAVRTDILGDPFGVGASRFNDAVTQVMAKSHFGPPVVFTTSPEVKTRASYHVVMAFDAPIGLGGERVCSDASTSDLKEPRPQLVHVVAAFCQGGYPLTYVVGEMRRDQGPDNAQFRNFVSSVTLRLFPAQNPEDRPDRDMFIME